MSLHETQKTLIILQRGLIVEFAPPPAHYHHPAPFCPRAVASYSRLIILHPPSPPSLPPPPSNLTPTRGSGYQQLRIVGQHLAGQQPPDRPADPARYRGRDRAREGFASVCLLWLVNSRAERMGGGGGRGERTGWGWGSRRQERGEGIRLSGLPDRLFVHGIPHFGMHNSEEGSGQKKKVCK